MNDFKIRIYEDRDFQEVVELMTVLHDYFVGLDDFDELKPFSTKQSAEAYIEHALRDVREMNGALFVADYEGEVVGFVQGVIKRHDDEVMYNLTHHLSVDGWIGLLITKPDFRSKGIGKALINQMKDYFKKNNCTVMRLFVASNNQLATDVYTKYGFKATDQKMGVRI